jgi:hypothetical protein
MTFWLTCRQVPERLWFIAQLPQSQRETSSNLVLTATKQGQHRVGNEINGFMDVGKQLLYSECKISLPILKRRAESWHCREQKEECKKLKINCGVIQSDKIITNKPWLLATSRSSYSQEWRNHTILLFWMTA